MGRLARVVTGVLGIAIAAVGALLCAFTTAHLSRAKDSFGMDLFVAGFFFATTLGGLAMIQLAWPGRLARLPGQMAATIFDRSTLFNPLMQAVIVYAIGLVLLPFSGKAAILVV